MEAFADFPTVAILSACAEFVETRKKRIAETREPFILQAMEEHWYQPARTREAAIEYLEGREHFHPYKQAEWIWSGSSDLLVQIGWLARVAHTYGIPTLQVSEVVIAALHKFMVSPSEPKQDE